MQFTDMEEAWGVALELLLGSRPDHTEVLYFAATILYTKICREGSKLSSGDGSLVVFLSQPLVTFMRQAVVERWPVDRVVMNRVVLAVVALAIKMKDGLAGCFQVNHERAWGQ